MPFSGPNLLGRPALPVIVAGAAANRRIETHA
jgi:hypothetical protein